MIWANSPAKALWDFKADHKNIRKYKYQYLIVKSSRNAIALYNSSLFNLMELFYLGI